MATIKIKQVKSQIGAPAVQKKTLVKFIEAMSKN